MRLLAIDYGTKKSGIAISDPLKIIAQPLTTIFYDKNNFEFLLNEIKKIIEINKPIEKIILGLPKNIDGTLSNNGKKVMQFKKYMEENNINIEIELFDEKYSTKNSLEVMKQMNLTIKKKKMKKDTIAAQKILENYMLKFNN
ncbi:MAG: Holliday junction resolvase RuvX [Mycoplasmataceae bacterium]|nr:Holliday junction resolvase RuvX [Mycoplasmataceae bacterium]MBR2849182.1 Holliday junction resolvase RuvX [Mycoplasmataceae bacterium]MBR2998982.1 Holliday junction resolvase RuvX [Mycoplasmataceae bacterium]MBR3259290.1 Holliday junction resolvase RuvX [Mycoplasmataceae bacterium]MBR4025719.1 Holliday junction resolvase RuvX [Mycoplasmataceae bacterium]